MRPSLALWLLRMAACAAVPAAAAGAGAPAAAGPSLDPSIPEGYRRGVVKRVVPASPRQRPVPCEHPVHIDLHFPDPLAEVSDAPVVVPGQETRGLRALGQADGNVDRAAALGEQPRPHVLLVCGPAAAGDDPRDARAGSHNPAYAEVVPADGNQASLGVEQLDLGEPHFTPAVHRAEDAEGDLLAPPLARGVRRSGGAAAPEGREHRRDVDRSCGLRLFQLVEDVLQDALLARLEPRKAAADLLERRGGALGAPAARCGSSRWLRQSLQRLRACISGR
mmetsp:Transcript_8359/g.20059  ORF Transcript_8359/g.20059 Transcript_8359/m.20059 type:complete len:279 (+) Transcript_8359:3356-4192(+)